VKKGALTIVGLGPARPEHMTNEALMVLRGASNGKSCLYALQHARKMVHNVFPDLYIRSLDYLYDIPGVERPMAYRDLAQMMLRKAFQDGEEVIYLVAGSPLFYNDAVLLIRKMAVKKKLPIRLVHGMSFVDLVLDQVHWTGFHGLQLYSAWNIAHDDVLLSTEAPALLCQLGEFSAAGDALDTTRSSSMLVVLQQKLLCVYPEEHLVSILYSSGPPNYGSLSEVVALKELAQRTVPVYSNLWIPRLEEEK